MEDSKVKAEAKTESGAPSPEFLENVEKLAEGPLRKLIKDSGFDRGVLMGLKVDPDAPDALLVMSVCPKETVTPKDMFFIMDTLITHMLKQIGPETLLIVLLKMVEHAVGKKCMSAEGLPAGGGHA